MRQSSNGIWQIKEIVDEKSFSEILKLPKAIIYISVNWSGQERLSRHVVYKIIDDLKDFEIPIFKIDCSDQQNKYVEYWLSMQSHSNLYSNGYGETLLVSNGKIGDYIKYPGELGIEKTR